MALQKALGRIVRDIKNRRQLEAYAVAAIALTLAILSIVEAAVPENLKWAALLVGVGLLVYQVTLPSTAGGRAEDILFDRSSFDAEPLSERVGGAREVWIFAPSAINVLSHRNCEALRKEVLADTRGVVRIVVLDPANETAVQLAIRQLDDSLDYPVQDFRQSLGATVRQLALMSAWPVAGTVDYRFLDYNPGFSLVAIDPTRPNGLVIVEMHGFRNDATHSRMHIELRRSDSDRWYDYWLDQFGDIWASARTAAAEQAESSAPPTAD
jgi:hypothetical protein